MYRRRGLQRWDLRVLYLYELRTGCSDETPAARSRGDGTAVHVDRLARGGAKAGVGVVAHAVAVQVPVASVAVAVELGRVGGRGAVVLSASAAVVIDVGIAGVATGIAVRVGLIGVVDQRAVVIAPARASAST